MRDANAHLSGNGVLAKMSYSRLRLFIIFVVVDAYDSSLMEAYANLEAYRLVKTIRCSMSRAETERNYPLGS
ncbi:hypothetical protein HDF14_000684 [Edaphobacter lichenicola]|uniref:Uncharacterized protein n=1 Tax=Tunturiibacter gelidiferens TaxID=3069689 RepID=A0A9X0QB36_9BACT|nr:hypothetical protein [Edaphobacter lichenicola]